MKTYFDGAEEEYYGYLAEVKRMEEEFEDSLVGNDDDETDND